MDQEQHPWESTSTDALGLTPMPHHRSANRKQKDKKDKMSHRNPTKNDTCSPTMPTCFPRTSSGVRTDDVFREGKPKYPHVPLHMRGERDPDEERRMSRLGIVFSADGGLVDDGDAVYILALDDFTKRVRRIDYFHGVIKYSVCLLYTSPSPRDKRQSRMPSSA